MKCPICGEPAIGIRKNGLGFVTVERVGGMGMGPAGVTHESTTPFR